MLFLKINGKNPRYDHEWTRKTREMQHLLYSSILYSVIAGYHLENVHVRGLESVTYPGPPVEVHLAVVFGINFSGDW
ncbi:MAG: hypothetical protein ACTSRA_01740 [Promethearchaeota archaeon]